MTEIKISPEIEAYGDSHVARRLHNEDAFEINAEAELVIVADGVGGHHAGEVASAITCDVISKSVADGTVLEEAIRQSNLAVLEAVESGQGKPGMASTVVAATLKGPEYQIAWVGDSRAYLWDGDLHLLTQDHSFVAAQLERGRITMEQARNHPRKNVIVQAIGLQNDNTLRVDTNNGVLGAGEMLLLCSDGLNDVLENAQISEVLATDSSLEKKCQTLIRTTLAEGGKDNVTVLLVAAASEGAAKSAVKPDIVWSYHPATESYSGLPERELEPLTRPGVTRVTPKSQGTTQMMPVAQVEAMRKLAEQESSKVRKQLTAAILVMGVVAGVLIWILSKNV